MEQNTSPKHMSDCSKGITTLTPLPPTPPHPPFCFGVFSANSSAKEQNCHSFYIIYFEWKSEHFFLKESLYAKEDKTANSPLWLIEQIYFTWGIKSISMVTWAVQTSGSVPPLKRIRESEDCQSWPGLFWVFQYELPQGLPFLKERARTHC